MIELIINDNSAYSKIAIDGDNYLVYYKGQEYYTIFKKPCWNDCGFSKYAKLLERKAKLAKLLSH